MKLILAILTTALISITGAEAAELRGSLPDPPVFKDKHPIWYKIGTPARVSYNSMKRVSVWIAPVLPVLSLGAMVAQTTGIYSIRR